MAANLSDFTYYLNRSLGGIGADEVNSDRGRAALAAVQQYDPGASYREVHGSDGQLLGYTLDYDASKLPGVNGSGSLGVTSGHGSGADYQPFFSTVGPNMDLINPSAVYNSPLYGKITDNSNLKNPSTLLDYLGPAAVALFGFAAPALLGGFQAGAAGAGAAGGAGGAAGGGDLAGGLGGGAADELANGGQMLATAPGANGVSIAVSNALDSLGLPTQLGLSDGAIGGAMASPGGLLSGGAGLFGGGSNPFSTAARILGGAGGAGGGAAPAGGGNLSLGSQRGATADLLSLLKGFYGDPSSKGREYLAMQRLGGLYG